MNKFDGEFEIKGKKDPTNKELDLIKKTNFDFKKFIKNDVSTPKEKELYEYVKKARDRI